ncbi:MULTISPECIES: flagellar basal-body MS-ring/collar protein FliF [Exiguobacterium]|uniref:Flagellar M-ring protein n=2 Tax=Bacillales Family XII. Incertae Sedis TaxID=539742 RepID=A0ABX8G638_EXIAC|nr:MULTISPECIES: flagellar basal-body MS-ring/collar protein FliF [Exiguobacterium]AOT01081.1 flagellar M-ring protein FliF [Exiguobacterium sp. U13-1]KNH36356.1 flagellar MS-ring protein [Exiguobacterium acetylicum]QWB29035.1 flagellar M-ring protein FliF [Exiguobacterium acetylicum]HBQ75989.1 flagellar basal body M-ring protein FliF [Exiguobacterium sp.]HCD59657.1 flagellar basal body M-ring protein FliF [Exiguobacterium sp.]
MNERLKARLGAMNTTWKEWSLAKKATILGIIVVVLAALIVAIIWLSKPTMTPLYSKLSPQEAGQVTEKLNEDGIASEVVTEANGVTILVPEANVENLKVELATAGIPKSGQIDYSFFSENAGFGTTDKEMNILERDTMQTELENLITQVNGIESAKVMITLPEKSVFLSDEKESSTVSVVLTSSAGSNLNNQTVQGLYHLIAKSIPNLKEENITIMDQYFTYYEPGSATQTAGGTDPMALKKTTENDLRKQIQQMLSVVLGPQKALVSVTADVDVTKRQEEQKLVEPVDPDKIEGIVTSAEKVAEAYTGSANAGTAGTGQNETTNFPAGTGTTGDTSEKTHDIINYEVNRITKQITGAPYEIRDLGIQIIVEPPKGQNQIDPQLQTDLQTMMYSIIRTSLTKTDAKATLTDAELANKVVVMSRPFAETTAATKTTTATPMWVWFALGGAAILVIGAVILLMRRRRANEIEELEEWTPIETEIPELSTEDTSDGAVKRKQLEKLAESNPDEFAKLLRTWLAED